MRSHLHVEYDSELNIKPYGEQLKIQHKQINIKTHQNKGKITPNHTEM